MAVPMSSVARSFSSHSLKSARATWKMAYLLLLGLFVHDFRSLLANIRSLLADILAIV
jgi:hypothetical protein